MHLKILRAPIGADKNAHRLEEAQERFKEVQNAYEILSDKHERAWWAWILWRGRGGIGVLGQHHGCFIHMKTVIG